MGLLAPLGLISSTSATTSNLANPAVNGAGKSRVWLPIVAFIILALLVAWLWKSCQQQQVAVPIDNRSDSSASEVAANVTPATFSLRTDNKGGVSHCHAGIGDQGLFAAMQAKVKEVFSSAQDCTLDTAKNYAASFTDQAGLASVLGLQVFWVC